MICKIIQLQTTMRCIYEPVAAPAVPPTAPSMPKDDEIHDYIPVKQNPVKQN